MHLLKMPTFSKIGPRILLTKKHEKYFWEIFNWYSFPEGYQTIVGNVFNR